MDILRGSFIVLIFLFGLRHGIDWDHIAAISDVTSLSKTKRHNLINGFFYILGHACMIALLATGAVVVGLRLPPEVDTVMERVVGVTLIILSIWLVYSILKYKGDFKLKSRWMLVFDGMEKVFHRIFPHTHPHVKISSNKNVRGTAYIIGVIHGIGAETPTQLLLFTTAAGSGHAYQSMLYVVVFILGLVISNTTISFMSVFGISQLRKHSLVYVAVGLLMAVLSMIIGIVFVLHAADILPALFGT